ncbi:MAG: tetratricopeptide repeat protein [Bryobacterales bacterium]|nr:tetratricopeptide repeat protein [Bryobacterales bacterium]
MTTVVRAVVSLVVAVCMLVAQPRSPEERQLLRAIQANPKNPAAHREYAIFLQMQGRGTEAIAYFRTALDLNPRSAESSYNLALALLHAGRAADSLQILDRYPSTAADRLALRGSVLNALGRFPEALTALRNAVALDPANPDTLYDLIITLLQTGGEQEATVWIDKGLRKFPHVGKMHAAGGMLAYAKGDNDRAIKAYQTAVKLEPDAADFHASLGDVYNAAGDLPGAVNSYRRAIALDANNATYYVKQGRALVKQRSNAAEQAFQQALRLDPNNAEAHFEAGKLLAARDDHRAAIDHYSRAVAAMPTLKEAWYQLSLSYRRTGRNEEAAAALTEFRKLSKEAAAEPVR